LTDLEIAELKRARAAKAKPRNERVRAAFAELGVTPAEAALFNVLHYGLKYPPFDVSSTAASPDYSIAGPVTEKECQAALESCLDRGWLQVIDGAALAKIAEELRKGRVLGPVYGLPWVAGVDFTHAGADLWLRHYRRGSTPWTSFAYTDVVHLKTARYFRTRAAALAALPEEDPDQVVTVTSPVPLGPWRAQWWRWFPEGFRVDVEERMRWQSRCSTGGWHCCLFHPPPQDAPPGLRRILDGHKASPAEWLLLAAMEWNWIGETAEFLRRVAWPEGGSFNVRVSEADCRTALDACLRKGWLRAADPPAIDEVRALLRDDPATLPVTCQIARREDEIDFTPEGAALYRRIAAEWLGPDWEDRLTVENEYYREEHWYCEEEEGLQGIASGYQARGEVVRASRLTAIGPWCVYWWERFPAGYRLELEIGDP
jgi:hypothetical protein